VIVVYFIHAVYYDHYFIIVVKLNNVTNYFKLLNATFSQLYRWTSQFSHDFNLVQLYVKFYISKPQQY